MLLSPAERECAPDPRHVRRGDRGAAVDLVLRRRRARAATARRAASSSAARHRRRRRLQRGEVGAPAAVVGAPGRRRSRPPASRSRPPRRGGGVAAEADRQRHVLAPLPSSPVRAPWTTLPGWVASCRSAPVVLEVLPRIARAAAVAARGLAPARAWRRRRSRPRRRRRRASCRPSPAVVVAVVARRPVGEHVQPQRLPGLGLEAHLRSTLSRAGSVIQVFVSRQRAFSVTWRNAERAGERGDGGAHARARRARCGAGRRRRPRGPRLPAVGDRELQPAEGRGGEVGVVDLAQRRLAQREVGVPFELVGGAEAVLVGRRPRVPRARRPRGGRLRAAAGAAGASTASTDTSRPAVRGDIGFLPWNGRPWPTRSRRASIVPRMIGALILGFVAGVIGRMLMPGDVFRHMSGPASWATSLPLGLAGAAVGYLIFTDAARDRRRRRLRPRRAPQRDHRRADRAAGRRLRAAADRRVTRAPPAGPAALAP